MVLTSSCGAWEWVQENIDSSVWENPGKFITWIRCVGRTTHAQRTRLLEVTAEFLVSLKDKHEYGLRIEGKLAVDVGENNLVPMMLYSDGKDRNMAKLKNMLEETGEMLRTSSEFGAWFARPQEPNAARTLTWNFRWKYDAQTRAELAAGTHYLQRKSSL